MGVGQPHPQGASMFADEAKDGVINPVIATNKQIVTSFFISCLPCIEVPFGAVMENPRCPDTRSKLITT